MKGTFLFELNGEEIEFIGRTNYGEYIIAVKTPSGPLPHEYFNISREEVTKALKLINYQAVKKRKKTWLYVKEKP